MIHPDICIYHKACDDGFAAAYAVWSAFCLDTVSFIPATYGEAPPNVAGAHVAIVDFSYKRPVLKEMAKTAETILVLDHHKTAQAELEGLGSECPNVTVQFDMERSGAVMAWNHFHPGQEIPELFKYIQDRDLWKKRLPCVDEFTAALRSYPQEFLIWDQLDVKELIDDGIAIQRYYRMLVEGAKQHFYMRDIGGYRVPVVNASLFMASEVAGELAEGNPFAAVYAEGENEVFWSLRSRAPDGLDVSEVAKKFGGGGHKHAAGFKVARPSI